jgi:hypothetical protein
LSPNFNDIDEPLYIKSVNMDTKFGKGGISIIVDNITNFRIEDLYENDFKELSI